MRYLLSKSGACLGYGTGIALLIILSSAFVYFFAGESRTISDNQSEIHKKDSKLTTIYRDKKIYEGAFLQAEGSSKNTQNATAVLTSHHLLAAPLIANSYAAIQREGVKRIILVSPDHFNSSFKDGNLAFTTDLGWDGLFSDIVSDRDFIRDISENTGGISLLKTIFLSEHGIYTEIPFLAHYFPRAKIVPLILKNDYNYDDFVKLGQALREKSGNETLLVVSSDFSHNTTHEQAEEWDRNSLEVIKNLDGAQFDELHNDCRSCIALLAGFLNGEKHNFHLIESKDSTDFGGTNSNVTSYISGFFTLNVENGSSAHTMSSIGRKVSVLFGGDMQFDRYIRSVTEKRGGAFVFDELRSALQKVDLVVANLEGSITDQKSVSETSAEGAHDNYVFTFPPETAALLKRENIALVNIGNNHILNFQEDGVQQTKARLEQSGVAQFGSPLAGDTRYSIRDIRGTRIAFVNYNQFVSNGRAKAFEDITAVKELSDFIVIYAHWGEEYVEALPAVKQLAHEFVDVGADLVIGSHPHVVQEREDYQGKPIYYSLGNFIFDQYFRPETQSGLLVRATFDTATDTIMTEDIPIHLRSNGQTELVSQ